jgi:GTP-binding protein
MTEFRKESAHSKSRRSKPLKARDLTSRFTASYYSVDQIPDDGRPQIAFAGRSNVGKSSLLNKLVGDRKLAKVSATPGKTRSINFFSVNERFYFVDLPGYGYAKVSRVERESWGNLIESYLTKSENLVGLVLLLDCRRDPTEQDIMLTEWLEERKLPVVIALTKCDKISKNELANKVREMVKSFNVEVIPFSTISGIGKNELWSAVAYLIEQNS